jgi:hypothetical protein
MPIDLRAREEHVQAAPATLPANGSKILAYRRRVGRLPKCRRYDDAVALVALNVL